MTLSKIFFMYLGLLKGQLTSFLTGRFFAKPQNLMKSHRPNSYITERKMKKYRKIRPFTSFQRALAFLLNIQYLFFLLDVSYVSAQPLNSGTPTPNAQSQQGSQFQNATRLQQELQHSQNRVANDSAQFGTRMQAPEQRGPDSRQPPQVQRADSAPQGTSGITVDHEFGGSTDVYNSSNDVQDSRYR